MQNVLIKELKKKFPVSPVSGLLRDILGGVVVALISIPISMGYARIAGLPMQYGLYGSVLPIFLFSLLTTSKDFVFGVDAAPAALVGSTVAAMGIIPESEQAQSFVPTLTLFVSFWLLVFYIFKAGRIVRYISTPVMGGFVTGICCTIILMQIPKLYGGDAGTGEGTELVGHIISQLPLFEPLSFILGLSTITVIMLGKKFIPKAPVSAIVMAFGAMLTLFLHINNYGVKLLPHVDSGFPGFRMLPEISSVHMLPDYLLNSLSIAVVILAESMLACRGNAMKDGYRLDTNREVLAYTAANFAASLSGCCPVNASVSRTGIVRQFGVRSQWFSVSAALVMVAVLYFAAPIIEYLPVPILTAIVISALMNACEFHEAAKLWKTSRNECYIFIGAFLSVLIFGTVAGVMIGVVLSFVAVVIRAVVPPRAFMGVIPGKDGFYSLGRNRESRPLKNTVIYRFGGNIFFANIDTLQSDIESAVTKDTKCIIINAGAVGSIDTTAADRLVLLYREYKRRGISLYITEHVGEVNDMLRQFGADELLRSGAVRMTTALALRDYGMSCPYPLESEENEVQYALSLRMQNKSRAQHIDSDARPRHISRRAKGIQPELEWVLGSDSEEYMDMIADELIEDFLGTEMTGKSFEEAGKKLRWGRLNYFDEDEILDRIEHRISDMQENDPEKFAGLVDILEHRREIIERRMFTMDEHVFDRLVAARKKYADKLREEDPASYEQFIARRKEYYREIESSDPELARKYRELYGEEITKKE